MAIIKIAEGAYFAPSYSVQTITRAYDPTISAQSFGGRSDEDEVMTDVWEARKDTDPWVVQPIIVRAD